MPIYKNINMPLFMNTFQTATIKITTENFFEGIIICFRVGNGSQLSSNFISRYLQMVVNSCVQSKQLQILNEYHNSSLSICVQAKSKKLTLIFKYFEFFVLTLMVVVKAHIRTMLMYAKNCQRFLRKELLSTNFEEIS